MSFDHRLLALIGKRLPAVFDVIPRGPQHRFANDRVSAVALNPQPLPPMPAVALGAAVAAEAVQLAFTASRLGQKPSVVFDVIDDWCPTRPRVPFKPPIHWPPVPEPEPHPDWFNDFHLGFAVRSAMAAEASAGTALGDVLGKLVDRSVNALQQTLHASDATRN